MEVIKVTPNECLKTLNVVRSYCQSNSLNDGGNVHSALLQIETECLKLISQGRRQSRITNFFQK